MIIIQLDSEQLSGLIQNAVRKVVSEIPQSNPKLPTPDFKYLAIKEIFARGICSKPCFYEHLKKGDFHLYKFGSRSFVLEEEFLAAFHKVKLNNKKGVSNG